MTYQIGKDICRIEMEIKELKKLKDAYIENNKVIVKNNTFLLKSINEIKDRLGVLEELYAKKGNSEAKSDKK